MYKNNFVVALKSDGKVLREIDDKVYLPFGTDYVIFLKNLDSRKASVGITIDGEDVLDCSRLILASDSDIELKGFLSGNRAEHGFRFIERTKKVEGHRGIKAEDGIIRIEIKYEKPVNYTVQRWPSFWMDVPAPVLYRASAPHYYSHYYSGNDSAVMSCAADPGITVKGEDVDQNFVNSYFGQYDNDTTVICLKLCGTKTEQPVFVNTKIVCSSCGKGCSSSQKFCSECGTRLLI